MGRRLFYDLKAPLRTFVEVTGTCNLGCRHCYNYWRDLGKSLDFAAAQHMKHVVAERALQQIIAHNVLSVVISGGEPLTNYDITRFVLEYCRGTPIKVSLNSNVVLLTKQMVKEMQMLGLRAIHTSVLGSSAIVHDAITGVHGSFKKTLQGIELCRKVNLYCDANMVVTKMNNHDIFDVAKVLQKMGHTAMTVDTAESPANCSDSSFFLTREEQIEVMNTIALINNKLKIKAVKATAVPYCVFPELQSFEPCLYSSCSAGQVSCTIGSDGQVRACPVASENVGSIMDFDLSELWEKLGDWRSDAVLPVKCKSCELVTRCGAGCRVGYCKNSPQIEPTKILMNPDNVKLAQHLLDKHKREHKTFSQGEKIRFNDFILREEEFGAVVFIDGGMRFVDEAGKKFFIKFIPNRTYNVAEIVTACGESFCNELLTSGLARML